ncbi:MAG TPA: Clp protease ClpC, partial [Bacteroidales bacterium]|nr:Clp protease ClpC [Bacteroidales bacterium]
MDYKYSNKIKEVLTYSREEAVRLGNTTIRTEHLFLGILRDGEGAAINILLELGLDLAETKKIIETKIRNTAISPSPTDPDSIPLIKNAERVLKLVALVARELKNDTISTVHLLLAILKDESSIVTQLLNENDIGYFTVKAELKPEIIEAKADFSDEEDERSFGSQRGPQQTPGKAVSDTPVLDNFGIDLTKAAEENRLDPIVGREREIERISQILSRRKKNNPILIGDPGVGKSAIAEGLALRIAKRKVSRILFNKRVVTLDLASIVAGTKYRGQFEERMKAILNELSKTNDVILFIDE